MSKIFAISDIHGHYDELMSLYKTLIKKAGLNPEVDTVVFLGDYVDRGPDSNRVIKQCMKWQKKYPHWKFLMGNHEHMMLDCLVYNQKTYKSWNIWWGQGGRETVYSYYPKKLTDYEKQITQPIDHIPTSHLSWIHSLDFYYETDDYFFVHAGVLPGVTLDEQRELADFHNEEIIKAMLWARDLFIDSNHDWGKKIIFGHTADGKGQWNEDGKKFRPIIMENKIGIDTAVCSPFGHLTAVELPAEKIHSQISSLFYDFMEKIK